jgi:glutathione S-transferase
VKLYWHPFSVMPRRVHITLREKGLGYEEVIVDLPGGALRTPEFRRLNPFSQVPVLEDGGLVLAESIAILEYLEERYPEPALLPSDPVQRALARQWMLWSSDYLFPAWKLWMEPRLGAGGGDAAAQQSRGHEAMAAHFDVLDARLRGRDWLAGAYSLADVCYAPFVTTLEFCGLTDLLANRPAVQAWVTRLAARPAVQETAPKI